MTPFARGSGDVENAPEDREDPDEPRTDEDADDAPREEADPDEQLLRPELDDRDRRRGLAAADEYEAEPKQRRIGDVPPESSVSYEREPPAARDRRRDGGEDDQLMDAAAAGAGDGDLDRDADADMDADGSGVAATGGGSGNGGGGRVVRRAPASPSLRRRRRP